MSVMINSFYKVIVMKVGVFESEIVDERNFGSEREAMLFREQVEHSSDRVAFMVAM